MREASGLLFIVTVFREIAFFQESKDTQMWEKYRQEIIYRATILIT